MAGVAEKARFYVERAVPQLREWEDKELFSKDEIRNIVQKRNDHEHRVLAPGNTPEEWSAYARWEQSLESLRGKRCRRLKIHHLDSAYAGQMRVLSIYERSVTRHPGSGELWREYLAYITKVRAAKRWRKTMTNALRMKPNDAELWAMAGSRSAHNGDMAAARSFFMRGCRFCTADERLWLEYARCEMAWLAKVEKRKGKKEEKLKPDKQGDEDELVLIGSEDEDDEDEDGTILPRPTKAQAKVIDKGEAKQLANNPAMDGAIPIAIFDIARKQTFFNVDAGEAFFVLVASFRDVPAQARISQHILGVLDAEYPNRAATCFCHVRQPVMGMEVNTADFARNLGDVLARLSKQLEVTVEREELVGLARGWVEGMLARGALDEGIRTVLEHTKGKMLP